MALAQVSIVKWVHEVVLDTFVKVPVPVTDDHTFVSGDWWEYNLDPIREAGNQCTLQSFRKFPEEDPIVLGCMRQKLGLVLIQRTDFSAVLESL